jgi:hypothetical protein
MGSEDVFAMELTLMDEQNVLVGSSLLYPQFIPFNFEE